MRNRWSMMLVGMLGLALLVAPGCVSNKKFSGSVEDTDSRIVAVESAVESNGRQIGDLKKDTDTRIGAAEGQASKALNVGNMAKSEAEKAAKAAQGKLLWTVTLTDDGVRFPFGAAELSSDAISVLDDLAGKIKAYGKALYVELEGHTDNVGAESYNTDLAFERAMAVRNYLNQNGGIPLHAMNTISLGEDHPVADNSSRDGRAQNRRVVVRVLE
jgi:peptidoglycan-associated lipoprotein